jgi:hypothetical protein
LACFSISPPEEFFSAGDLKPVPASSASGQARPLRFSPLQIPALSAYLKMQRIELPIEPTIR